MSEHLYRSQSYLQSVPQTVESLADLTSGLVIANAVLVNTSP